jgi:hypothetical protein
VSVFFTNLRIYSLFLAGFSSFNRITPISVQEKETGYGGGQMNEPHNRHNMTMSSFEGMSMMNFVITINLTSRSEISGSHGGEYEGGCLLGCCAV